MDSLAHRAPAPDLLRLRPFQAFLAANALERFAAAAMTVLLGFQVWELTGDALYLAWLGLVEAVPGVTLVLYGGHVADRSSRRRLVLGGTLALSAIAACLAASSAAGPVGIGHTALLAVLFAAAFLAGVARAFEGPAAAGLEAHVVPLSQLMRGTSLLATTSRLADVLGPVAGGLAWSVVGGGPTYAATAVLFGLAAAAVAWGVEEGPTVVTEGSPGGEGALREIGAGVRYVFRDQLLVGSMALDLFAVFFGGATALLPVFATEILHVGATGLGLLRGAIGAGSLLAALLAGRFLPQRHAGWTLLGVIAGFGAAIVVFGLSRSLPLSLFALFVAGLCDGTSVVIRRAIMRLASPEGMRGRIAAVKSVFVGSSNELGAFESGIAASLFGPVAAVWGGGLVTLLVVAGTAWLAPRLRRLDLDALAAAPPFPSKAETG